jgi:two-component system LytT family response regulator
MHMASESLLDSSWRRSEMRSDDDATGKLNVLVVEDEPLAREALEKLLRANAGVDRLLVAADAASALDLLASSDVDIVFLDVNMPEMNGLDLADRLRGRGNVPALVFVTAYDEFALEAFDRRAVDYVLKPFTEQRIEKAFQAAAERARADRAVRLLSELPELLHQLRVPRQPDRIAIKSERRILFIEPREIMYVEAEGNYVLLHGKAKSHMLRESLRNVEQTLEPYGFVRIHRSTLVNAAHVSAVQPWTTGEYILHLKNGKELTVTRKYKANLSRLARRGLGGDDLA